MSELPTRTVKRPGRKKLPLHIKKRNYTTKLDPWIIERLEKEKNASRLIRAALLAHTGWVDKTRTENYTDP